jgi:hypothetical protein
MPPGPISQGDRSLVIHGADSQVDLLTILQVAGRLEYRGHPSKARGKLVHINCSLTVVSLTRTPVHISRHDPACRYPSVNEMRYCDRCCSRDQTNIYVRPSSPSMLACGAGFARATEHGRSPHGSRRLQHLQWDRFAQQNGRFSSVCPSTKPPATRMPHAFPRFDLGSPVCTGMRRANNMGYHRMFANNVAATHMLRRPGCSMKRALSSSDVGSGHPSPLVPRVAIGFKVRDRSLPGRNRPWDRRLRVICRPGDRNRNTSNSHR